MEIKLYKRKFFIIIIYIPIFVLLSIFILAVLIEGLVRGAMEGLWEPFAAFVFLLILIILSLPIALIFKGKKYVFTEEQIFVYKGKNLLKQYK